MPNRHLVRREHSATPEEVTSLRRNLVAGMDRAGTIKPHLEELKDLGPDVAGLDLLSFTADVTAAGVITQPQKETLPGGYYAELFEIRGAGAIPLTDPELTHCIYFNVKDTERSGNLFSSDVEMCFLTDAQGGSPPLKFERGLYVFDPGSRVEVQFSVDSTATIGYADQASIAKRWSVLLAFNLFTL